MRRCFMVAVAALCLKKLQTGCIACIVKDKYAVCYSNDKMTASIMPIQVNEEM